MSTTQIAEIQLQPSRSADYSAYVPVRLGNLMTAAFIDNGNAFANLISPETWHLHCSARAGTSTLGWDRGRREKNEDPGTGPPD